MTYLKDLFDVENPKCLYCQGECNINARTIGYPINHIETFICRECNEYFEKHWFENLKGQEEFITYCSLSCQGIVITEAYDDCQETEIGIAKVGENPFAFTTAWVPWFPLDLTDKDQLYQKLRTYITFS